MDRSYDARNRISTLVFSDANPSTWTMGYGFDANAHPASLVYPEGLALTINANALGQATSVASGAQTY